MDENIEVVPVNIETERAEITRLLRRSFIGSAEEMRLTEENCPHHVAYMTEERLREQLARGSRCLGIAWRGEWIGFVAVAPYMDNYEITRLAVTPEHRRNGYGRKLIDAACDAARELGLTEISLGMIDENRVLKKWYEAQGFIPGEPFRNPGDLFTRCGMTKRL